MSDPGKDSGSDLGRGVVLEEVAVEVSELLPAPPDEVYALLTDVERMGGLGPENTRSAWESEDRGVGAVFRGWNVVQGNAYDVPCTVVAAAPPRAFAWAVGDTALPSATWSYDLVEEGGGTRVTQRFQHGPGRTFLRRAIAAEPDRAAELVQQRMTQIEAGMRTTLLAAAALLRER